MRLWGTQAVQMQPSEIQIRMVILPFIGLLRPEFLHLPSGGIQAIVDHIQAKQLPVDKYGRVMTTVIEECYNELSQWAVEEFKEPVVDKREFLRLKAKAAEDYRNQSHSSLIRVTLAEANKPVVPLLREVQLRHDQSPAVTREK